MLKSATGGLYLAQGAVHKALSARIDSLAPRVLDLGTGSGKWAIDMANEFPHAEVLGVDLAPVNPSSCVAAEVFSPNRATVTDYNLQFRKVPPNCRFILGDCNICLDDPSYESAFDMIHARCIITGILNYRKFIQAMCKALRPGGVLFVMEGRPVSFNEHRQELGVQDEDDSARNDQLNYIEDIPAWLKAMGDAWEEVGDRSIWIPIGPWDKSSPELAIQGEAMRQDFLIFTESVQPLLLLRGHPKESVQKWAQNARKELEELPFKLWTKLNY
ncbi:hypothetical protein FS837_000218 [Tulasnella sp. UAMH 9824]|nr:hypothetical protein FS837_000218 [Tulasnella sp. UAMH 9824]